MAKPKLLWVSDNPLFSFIGQSIVTRQVLSRIHERYEVAVAGFGTPPDAQQSIFGGLPYEIYVIQRWDQDGLHKVIDEFDPDVVLLSHDCWLFPWLKETKDKYHNKKFIGWFTIDGEPLSVHWKNIFDCCDLILSPTEYGRQVIKEKLFYTPVKVVPYGVDRKLYKPRESKEQIIAELAALGMKVNIDPECFIAIFWGHNQSKKNLPALYDAWKSANMQDEKAILLYVIHGYKAQKGKWILPGDWDWRAELDDPSVVVLERTYPDHIMSRLVQLADTMVFPSIGEGFGLPALEAMSCGIPVITTDYAGVTEFCHHDQNAMMVPGVMMAGEFNVRRIAVDPVILGDEIRRMHRIWSKRPDLYQQMSDCAQETAEFYSWDRSAKLITEAIDRVVDEQYKREWCVSRI